MTGTQLTHKQRTLSPTSASSARDLAFLDRALVKILGHPAQTQTIVFALIETLYELRKQTLDREWDDLRLQVMKHPIRRLLHQDPFTQRSFQKPRGYAGDAITLDYIYTQCPPDNISDLGRRLFHHFVADYPVCKGVRYRRDYSARLVDLAARANPALRVLSVGCGHLREIEASTAAKHGQIGTIVALDQDPKSLAFVRAAYASQPVEPVHASISALLSRKVFAGSLPQFDLIYVLGLYDYLNQRLAQRLTLRLYELLAPGGKLVIANALPHFMEIGYMETFMDWRLVYRDLPTLNGVARDIPASTMETCQMIVEPNGCFAFLEIEKLS